MGKETKIIASLDIDSAKLKENMAVIKKEIDDLRQKQAKLTENGKEATKGFVENEAAIKKLESIYRAQNKALQDHMDANGKLLSQKEQIKNATNAVNKSENDYIANNAELIRLKKELNSNSDNYEKRLAQINAKLLENNNWLKENGSEHAKLITTMSDYKDRVLEGFNSINIFNGGLTGFISRAQEAGGVGPLFKNAFNGITSGIEGMGKAIMANPAGAILTVIVYAVTALYDAFKSFTPIVHAVEQGMAAVSAVFDSVKNSIIGLVTGATSVSDFFSGFVSSAADAATEAIKLREAQQKLADQAELQEIANQKAKNSIEDYRRTVNDTTKTEGERMKALQDALAVEKQNMAERKKIAVETYNLAVNQLANGKNLSTEEKRMIQEKGFEYAKELAQRKMITEEELETLKKAHLEREKIYGEDSALSQKQADELKKFYADRQAEQKAAAQKERERRQKALDDALAKQKQMLNLYVAQEGAKAKTLEEQLKFEEEFAQKSLDILKTELKQKKISQAEYETAVANLTTERLQKVAQLTADHGDAMLKLYIEEHKSLLDSGQELTAELVKQERERLDTIYKMKLENMSREAGLDAEKVKAKRLANEELTTEEVNYLTAVMQLETEHKAGLTAADQALKDADAARLEEEKARKAEAREAEYQQNLADGMSKYEAQRELEAQRYAEEVAEIQARREAGLITEAEHDKLLEEAAKSSAERQKAISKDEADYKTAMRNKLMNDMLTIVGKESKAGKAIAMAQATMDTYQSAVAAYRSQMTMDPSSPVRGAIAAAAAVAMGLKNIQKIAGVKEPKFEKGGLMAVGGNRHSAGGTLFRGEDGTAFEAEQGELIGVMNRNAARHFMAFNNTFPSGGASAPNYFAGGGIVSREIAAPALNPDEIAAKLAESYRAMPAPVVAVQDIITEGNSYVQVRDGANF
jgi:hypothetical protein